MLNIIHGADFHLDAPFASLPPDRAAARRAEQRQLLDRLAALAADRWADLVLLAGDLLDSGETYYETAQALSRTLGQIEVPVFIAPGNHDFYSARSLYAGMKWPENVHIFTSPQIEGVELPGLNCVVHGAAFPSPKMERSPLREFHAPADGKVHVMVLHGDVGGNGAYGPLDPEDIAASRLRYLALGHIHSCSGLQRAGETWWAYPGCPEGRGFDELGDKGVLAVTLQEDGGTEAEFVPLAARRYGILTVDLSDGTPPEQALLAALPQGTKRDVYRILLTGERDGAAPDLAALEEMILSRFYSVTLRDQTRPRRRLWERVEEDNLTGLFLREMRGALEGAEVSRSLVEQAVRFGLAALENGEDCCP